MQTAYISKLMELAERDKNVMHLLADSGTGYDEMFRRNFPEQIINFGIAEENMVAAAAGMATCEKIPFVYTAGAFLCYRSLEFIRNDICFQNLNVKLIGMGSGLSWSSLGPTHHTTEDIAVLRSLPNLMILAPATPKQVFEAAETAYNHIGPVYIRIGMNHEKEFFPDDHTLAAGKNDVLFEGKVVVVFSVGSILEEVYEAVSKLIDSGNSIGLINVSTVKPFNYEDAYEHIKNAKAVVSVEEHSVFGGLGSIMAEVIAKYRLDLKLETLGLNDRFAAGYGSIKAVRKANGFDSESLYNKIKKVCDVI